MLTHITLVVLVTIAGTASAQPSTVEPQPPGATPTIVMPAEPRFARRPSDERLFLTPTPLTMRPGAISLSDDEVISARLAVGLSEHLQLDLRLGGLLIPGAAGGALALPGGLAAGGGAGVVLLGAVDLGLKYAVLEESDSAPGIAIGYDMLDVFGIGAGGAGIVLVGAGAAGGGIVAVGGANLQFNLFTLVAGKHLGKTGRLLVTGGTYLLDNHHYLPQSAAFAAACGAGGVGDAGAGDKVEPCGGNSTTIDRIPLQAQPFVGVERAVGKKSSLAGELLVSPHLANTIGTTGFRYVYTYGEFAARLDMALLWSRVGYPLPWAGLGLHFR
jgi:hypothetical protein